MKIFIAISILFSVGTTFATPLVCPRAEQIEQKIADNNDEWCNGTRFVEGANSLFEFEANAFRDDNLTPALHDNVHDAKWLIRKSTRDMREHTLCLDIACEKIWNACAGNKNFNDEKSQAEWCSTSATEFSLIEQEKMKQVAIENQTRKSRSNLREKMRAIEVRTSQLFIPQLQKFFAEYRRFTEKVPTFLSNPL